MFSTFQGGFFGEDEETSSYFQPDAVPFNPGKDVSYVGLQTKDPHPI